MKNAHRMFLVSLLGLVAGLCGLVSNGVASTAVAAATATRNTGAVSPQKETPIANPVAECIKRENATHKANSDGINRAYNSEVNAAKSAQQSAAKAANDAYDSAAKAANDAQRANLASADAIWAASLKAADEAFQACIARHPPPPVDYNACQRAKAAAVSSAAAAHANAIAAGMVGPAALLNQALDQRDAALQHAQDMLAITLNRAKDARDQALALENDRHEAALKACLGQ